MNEDDPKGVLGRLFSGWNRMRENALADIALGFTPAGVAADVQDASRAIRDRDLVGLGLAGVGFLPGGDIAKAVAKRIPRRVLTGTPSGTLSLEDILAGRASRFDPETSGRIADYAARQYKEALERGIPMDAGSIARRRAEMFPVEGFHGAASPRNIERMVGSDLLSENPVTGRSTFFEIGKEPRGVASSYSGLEKEIPVAINPGRMLDIEGRGRLYSDIDAGDVMRSIYDTSDLTEDEIVDIILERRPFQWEDIGGGRVSKQRLQRLYDEFDPAFDPMRDFDPSVRPLSMALDTDEIVEIAKDAGYDSAMMRDIRDNMGLFDPDILDPDVVSGGMGDPGDVLSVFNPVGRVRHRSAVFDPEKKNLGNLFAGIAGASIGGSALARALQENRREEY